MNITLLGMFKRQIMIRQGENARWMKYKYGRWMVIAMKGIKGDVRLFI